MRKYGVLGDFMVRKLFELIVSVFDKRIADASADFERFYWIDKDINEAIVELRVSECFN